MKLTKYVEYCGGFSLIDCLMLGLTFFRFRKPPHICEVSFSLKKGYVGLSYFIEKINKLTSFSTTPKQQNDIIFYFVQITLRIEEAFDNGSLTKKNFRKFLLKNNPSKCLNLNKIKQAIGNIKSLCKNNIAYRDFLENLIKTWETHQIREVDQTMGRTISLENALKASEDRGMFYFLSLVYALNPSKLSKNTKKIISIAGSWFQIIDDYSDRKKDKNEKNTPFTLSKEKSFTLFNEYIVNYQKQMQVLIEPKHPLVKFMRNISVLWPSISFLGDWHP